MRSLVAHIRIALPFVLAAALLGSPSLVAQTPDASPVAGQFPQGPLGEHIQWLLDTANAGAGNVNIDTINEHFSPAFFEQTTMGELFGTLTDLQSAGITYDIDPTQIVTTRDLPATSGRFILIGSDGLRNTFSIRIDRESGMIVDFSLQAASDATPVASPEYGSR